MTEMRPVVAPAGTFALIWVALATVNTVAVTPLNLTVLLLGVVLNPVP
jgi:hypothetical protein